MPRNQPQAGGRRWPRAARPARRCGGMHVGESARAALVVHRGHKHQPTQISASNARDRTSATPAATSQTRSCRRSHPASRSPARRGRTSAAGFERARVSPESDTGRVGRGHQRPTPAASACRLVRSGCALPSSLKRGQAAFRVSNVRRGTSNPRTWRMASTREHENQRAGAHQIEHVARDPSRRAATRSRASAPSVRPARSTSCPRIRYGATASTMSIARLKTNRSGCARTCSRKRP